MAWLPQFVFRRAEGAGVHGKEKPAQTAVENRTANMNTTPNREDAGQNGPGTDETATQTWSGMPDLPSLAFDREHGDEVEAARRQFSAQWDSLDSAA